MSLIACILNNKVPFIISDLLFSSSDLNTPIQLPTNNFNIDKFLPNSLIYKPSFLAQKIYIIKSNVCIALAGSELEMVRFLEDFKLRCSYVETVTESYVRNFLDEYDFDSEFADSAFLIIVWEPRGESSKYEGLINFPNDDTWDISQSKIYGQVYACGSGKKSFKSIINQDGKFKTTYPTEEIWHAMQLSLALIAKLLAIEKLTLCTLANAWGGGFEIAFFNGIEFEKLDKIAFVVSHGQFNSEGDIGLPLPKLIIYPRYIDNILTITAIEIFNAKRLDSGDSIRIVSQLNEYDVNVFIVPGIERNQIIPDYKTIDFSFHTYSLAMGYAIITKDNGTYNPAFYSYQKNLEVRYKKGEDVEILLSAEINDGIRNEAKAVFSNL